ncbi:Rha family phage regulatory protein [Fontibacillus solani]|uniref:Rha family phage regulatory protein n=1 Tax=Fontibacillus solani TaxID=1572857 RepID=A0A7W3XSG1_9BACL|nr:Rha family transcriptional regulator [Fontibacillus solani]MBA9086538.1 Rha family phage regulatory protein [Fontibacillus solani]
MLNTSLVVPAAQDLLDEHFVYVEDGVAKTDSRSIASKFNKRHADVLRSIKNLECSPEFTERNFTSSEYIDGSGRTLPTYKMTRDGFTFLITGFTGKEAAKYKEDFIAAFNWMEKQLFNKNRPSESPLLLQTVKQLEEQVQEVKQQMDNSVTLKTHEQKVVQQAVGRRVAVLTKNKAKQPELYRQLYRALYSRFEITSYRDLLMKDFEEALKFIAFWMPLSANERTDALSS